MLAEWNCVLAYLLAIDTLYLAPGASYLDLNVPLIGSHFACIEGVCN